RGPVPKLVVAEGGQEEALASEPRELHRRDRSAAGRLLPGLDGVDDLARRGHVVHARELDPLDVADDRDAGQCAGTGACARSAAALTPSPKVGKTWCIRAMSSTVAPSRRPRD